MSESVFVEFLYESSDADRLGDIWSHFDARSADDDRIDPGERSESLLNLTYGSVSCLVESFSDASGEARWAVPDVPHVEVSIDELLFREAAESEAAPSLETRLDDAVELVTELYLATDDRVRVGYGVPAYHVEAILDGLVGLPATGESLTEDAIEYASWLTVFPPELVESYGRDTLLSAPAWRVEELPDGGVLLVAYERPDRPDGDALDAVHDHLGLSEQWPDFW